MSLLETSPCIPKDYQELSPCLPEDYQPFTYGKECGCSSRQFSDHSFFTTALDIVYGENTLFVGLAEASSNLFLRSETQHHGRANLRTSLRKYFYQAPERIEFPSPARPKETEIRRWLELIFVDHRIDRISSSLASRVFQEMLNFQREQRQRQGGTVTITRSNRNTFCSDLRAVCKLWIHECQSKVVQLSKQISDRLPALIPSNDTIPNAFAEATLQFLEPRVRKFWEDTVLSKRYSLLGVQQVILYLKDEWQDKHLKFMFNASMRCKYFNLPHPSWVHEAQYVGFVELRPRAASSPIAMGLLIPPRRFRSRKNYQYDEISDRNKDYDITDGFHIIQGHYAAPFGMAMDHDAWRNCENVLERSSEIDLSFRSSFMAMNDHEKDSGATCGNLCIIQSAGLLSNAHVAFPRDYARIPGTFECSYLAAKHNKKKKFNPEAELFPKDIQIILSEDCGKIRAVLKKKDLRDDRSLGRINPNTIALCERILEAYLEADQPVICFCNSDQLYGPREDKDVGREDTLHCVVLNGFRRMDSTNESKYNSEDYLSEYCTTRLSHVIAHDPSWGPFLPIPMDRCLHAAATYNRHNRSTTLEFIAVTRDFIKSCPDDCLDDFLKRVKRSDNEFSQIVDDAPDFDGINDLVNKGYDVSISLLRLGDIQSRIFELPDRFDPIHFQQGLTPQQLRQEADLFLKALGDHRRHFWVVQLLKRKSGKIISIDCYDAHAEGAVQHIWHCYPQLTEKTFNQDIIRLATLADLLPIDPPDTSNEAAHEPKKHANITPSVMTSSLPTNVGQSVKILPDNVALELYLLRMRDIIDIHDTIGPLTLDTQRVLSLGNLVTSLKKLCNRGVLPDRWENYLSVLKSDENTSPVYRNIVSKLLKRGYISSLDILAERKNLDKIEKWVCKVLESRPGLKLSALATYFPQIASGDTERQRYIRDALTNSMILGRKLKKTGHFFKDVVVEVVLGSFLDKTNNNTFKIRSEEDVFRSVINALREAYDIAVAEVPGPYQSTFSVELEPSHCFLLRDKNTLHTLCSLLAPEGQLIDNKVTLNLDIGHYIAAGIPPEVVQEYLELFSHAHVSIINREGEQQHYRDLPIKPDLFGSSWNKTLRYINLLNQRYGTNKSPMSGAISLELEGCARQHWVTESLEHLKKVCH